MEEGDESVAAFKALGLNPRRLVDDGLDIVDDVCSEAFKCARKKAASEKVLGAAMAAQKAEELDRGLNAIHHLVLDELDKRMTTWERYCFGKIFTLRREGSVLPGDAPPNVRTGPGDREKEKQKEQGSTSSVHGHSGRLLHYVRRQRSWDAQEAPKELGRGKQVIKEGAPKELGRGKPSVKVKEEQDASQELGRGRRSKKPNPNVAGPSWSID